MNILHITPLRYLERFDGAPMYMALTHLVLKYPEYAKFMRRQSEEGSYIILDNSLIELGSSVSLETVLEAADIIKAHEIILPDVFMDGPKTIEAVKSAIVKLNSMSRIGDFNIMAVCQGNDVVSFKTCFDELSKIPEVSVIGIPKLTADLSPMGRPGFEHLWNKPEYTKTIHLLGLKYSFTELLEYKNPGRIRSVDTLLMSYMSRYKMNIITGIRPNGHTLQLDSDREMQINYDNAAASMAHLQMLINNPLTERYL